MCILSILFAIPDKIVIEFSNIFAFSVYFCIMLGSSNLTTKKKQGISALLPYIHFNVVRPSLGGLSLIIIFLVLPALLPFKPRAAHVRLGTVVDYGAPSSFPSILYSPAALRFSTVP